MLATREDEHLARLCACQAMSGMGDIYQPLIVPNAVSLTPPAYAPISSTLPYALQTGANTVLSPPAPTPIPVKTPFDWDKFGSSVTNLLTAYGNVTTTQNQTEAMKAEAERQKNIAKLAEQTSAAQVKAAAMSAAANSQPQGMGTGTKIAIGAGVLVAAFAAYKAFA